MKNSTIVLLLLAPFLVLGTLILLNPTRGRVVSLTVVNWIALALTVVGGFISFVGTQIGSPGTAKLGGSDRVRFAEHRHDRLRSGRAPAAGRMTAGTSPTHAAS